MEEFVGNIWHRFISRQSATAFPAAAITLEPLLPQLAPFFRALGGPAGMQLEGAEPRPFRAPRRFMQKLAGSHTHFTVCWQNDLSLRLPPVIAQFDSPALNEALYFWLTALAAQQPRLEHWFEDNQRATTQLLSRRPGLARSYDALLMATLQQRQQLVLDDAALDREQAIQQALINPGSVSTLPRAPGDPLPVPLWLYPAPLHAVSVAAEDQLDKPGGKGSAPAEQQQQPRKQARRIDDRKKTDGLMIFQLEALFTRVEHVELDRVQEEDLDDDSSPEDLDIITLSRQRRAGAGKLKFDLDLPAPQHDELPLGEGIRLPEWDYRRQQLRPDYCLLQPMLADDALPAPLPEHLQSPARLLRNRFSCLKPQRSWLRRQPQGEEIELDSWLDHLTQPGRNSEPVACFRQRQPVERDLSCLLLADISMSTDAGINADQRVIDVIRDSLQLFAEALSASRDRFAIYGFSSIRNKQVRYHLLKNFNEPYADPVRGRIQALKPGFYTRMGAAIRQSTDILQRQRSQQKLLLILSDGKPNDIDHYEGRYGIEDTRQAVQQARKAGLQPFCVTIDEQAADYLPYLFGDRGYAVVSDLSRLPTLLPKLYLNLTHAH